MKLISTSIYSAAISFVRISSGFVAGKIVAMLTGPAGVALVGQFTNFLTVVLTFSNGGINTGIVKYTAQHEGDEEQLKKLFSTGLKISISCSALIGILLLFIAPYISTWILNSPNYQTAIRILGVTIILYSINSFLICVLNGKKQIRVYSIANMAGSITGLALTIVLVYVYKLEGAIYALILAPSLVFFVTLGMVIKSNWFSWTYFRKDFDRKTANLLFQFSLMALVTVLTAPIAQIVVRNYIINNLGIAPAGYWQGMIRISDGYLILITTTLSTYYLPKLSSLQKQSELRKEIFNGYKITLPIVLVGCIIVYLFRTFIIKLLFTSSFLEMEQLFFFQMLGDFLKVAAWLLAFLMLAKAMTKVYIINEIVFNVTYVLLCIICIKYWGFVGLSIAFAINYFIYLIVILLIFKKFILNRAN